MTNQASNRIQTWQLVAAILALLLTAVGLWAGGVFDSIFGPPEVPTRMVGPSLNDGKGDVCGRFFMTPSGITLKKGDHFEIKASGSICWEYDTRCGGPDQDATQGLWGLHYSIGTDGEILPAGSNLSDVAYSDGELYLVIPDWKKPEYERREDKYYRDNVGCFTVEVVTGTH